MFGSVGWYLSVLFYSWTGASATGSALGVSVTTVAGAAGASSAWVKLHVSPLEQLPRAKWRQTSVRFRSVLIPDLKLEASPDPDPGIPACEKLHWTPIAQ